MRGVFLTPFSFSKGSRYFWLKNIFCCVYLSTSTIFLSSRAFAGYFPMSVALLNPIFCLLQMKLKKALAEKYRFSRYSKSFVSGNLIETSDIVSAVVLLLEWQIIFISNDTDTTVPQYLISKLHRLFLILEKIISSFETVTMLADGIK